MTYDGLVSLFIVLMLVGPRVMEVTRWGFVNPTIAIFDDGKVDKAAIAV